MANIFRRIADLFKEEKKIEELNAEDLEMIRGEIAGVNGIAEDSRTVGKDYIFFAIKGNVYNGEDYIESAINAGAAKVVVHVSCNLEEIAAYKRNKDNPKIKFIKVNTPRLILAHAAAMFYEKQPENLVAITGTCGKTSTSYMFVQLAEACGKKAACIGSEGILHMRESKFIDEYNKKVRDGLHVFSSPPPVLLHETLAKLHDEGYTHVAIEMTSQGNDQYRMDGLRLTTAAFTNFYPEHLDYHPTEDDYFEAKARLVTELLPKGSTIVLNADARRCLRLSELALRNSIKRVKFGSSVDGQGIEIRKTLTTGNARNGSITSARLKVYQTHVCFHMKIPAYFEIYNIVCAMCLGTILDFDLKTMVDYTLKLKTVSGRMEKVDVYGDAPIYIDYAHTPNALENVLRDLKGKDTCQYQHISLVFGCGGDRDKYKRCEMGDMAEKYADNVIITDDNPRDEDPIEIKEHILAGCPRARYIPNRAKAIKTALSELPDTDAALVIAGKGNEKVQIVKGKAIPCDDYEHVRKALDSLPKKSHE